MKSITIDIPGPCPTQGSVKTFAFRRKNGKLGSSVVHQNDKAIKEFRTKVREQIKDHHDDFYADSNEIGYIVEMISYIERPRTSKRPLPTVKGSGDIDKLLRAVLDSLTYDEDKNPVGLYNDDAQVIKAIGLKLYVNENNPTEHTIIKITKIVLSSEFSKTSGVFEENVENSVDENL